MTKMELDVVANGNGGTNMPQLNPMGKFVGKKVFPAILELQGNSNSKNKNVTLIYKSSGLDPIKFLKPSNNQNLSEVFGYSRINRMPAIEALDTVKVRRRCRSLSPKANGLIEELLGGSNLPRRGRGAMGTLKCRSSPYGGKMKVTFRINRFFVYSRRFGSVAPLRANLGRKGRKPPNESLSELAQMFSTQCSLVTMKPEFK